MRRHRAWVQAGAAALLVVAVVATGATFLIYRALEEAKSNFAQARVTVRDFTTSVSKSIELRRNLPGLQKFRSELLNQALVYHKDFLSKHDHEPRLQAEVAEAYYQIGKVTAEIGSEREAVDRLKKAAGIQEELVKAQHDSVGSIHALALTYYDLGKLQLVIGRRKDGESSSLRAARSPNEAGPARAAERTLPKRSRQDSHRNCRFEILQLPSSRCGARLRESR